MSVEAEGVPGNETRDQEKPTGGERPDALTGMVFHAMRMMAGTLVSRVLGLVREMLTAALFGATRQLDAFFVAYTLANLARQLLAEGALSASFVPVFSRTLSADGQDRARKLANEALTVLIFGCSLVVAVGLIFAPLFVDIMAPGFVSHERLLAISLTRIMFPFLMLVSVGALAMGAASLFPLSRPPSATLSISSSCWRCGAGSRSGTSRSRCCSAGLFICSCRSTGAAG